jgi:hypothetical protein
MHFHFKEALHYNKLFLIVLPLLIFIWSKKLNFELKKSEVRSRKSEVKMIPKNVVKSPKQETSGFRLQTPDF